MRLLIILFSVMMLSACGPARDDTQQAQRDPEETARAMMQVGNFAGAAAEYLNLAEQDQKNASVYQLKAVAAYVEAGLYKDAESILNQTSVDETDSLQNLRRQILSARLELEFGQAANALSLLQQISENEIPQGLRKSYHDILARTYLANGEYLNAANQRLHIQPYLSLPVEIDQNTESLWKIFESIPEPELDALRLSASETLSPWFELAAIYQAYRFQPATLSSVIDGWVQRYPEHPAYSVVVPGLIEQSAQFVDRPSKIGLLLPFSSQYQKASTAIRDGFLAAWYLDTGEKAQIEIYDTNSLDIIETYQQAVNDGVDYVVGPLEKEAINQLMQQNELPVRVLALNRSDQDPEQLMSDSLIQFGLSPEDEARQVAEIALSDGHTLALVITPDIPWGERIADAFKQRWIELGGAVLEHSYFETNTQDFATPVKSLLNIDNSEQRARDLRSKLGRKIHSVERRRQDADFIFTAAVPGDARQLFPQLRFHRAGDLPVYSTSHIFSGVVDSARDTDLENVMFVDMPWLLDTRRQLSLIQDALNRNWSQDKSNYRRLYALGIDAYYLIPEIGRLSNDRNRYFSGETGDLIITEDNLIKRKLQRAQFVEGKPVLLN